jgi:flagellar biosynthesis/type III secretory pathway protein FliH
MRTSAPPRPAQPRPDILFAEDFDAPPGVTVLDDAADAPPPEPTFTAETLAASRTEAYAEGHRNGLAKAAADRAEVTLQMLGVIAERLEGGRAEAARVAEESAEALARLLLGTLASMLPALCARHGAEEVAALARAVLPALKREPRVTIRVSPHVAVAVEQELARFDPDLRERVALVPTDAVPPGDARIAWTDGAAQRDAAALWRDVADALAPLDLLPPDLAPPFAAMAA